MLPQFGYIVAQAGADSRLPSQGLYGRSHSRSPSPPLAQQSQQQQSNPQLQQQTQQQQGQQQNQLIHGGATMNKETKSYYSAAPRSPSADPTSMHQKVAGNPSRSTMLPPSAATPSSSHMQQQQQPPVPPYMYSTTSVPPHIASSHGGHMDYNAHYYAGYDRGTGIDSHQQAAGTGASFRPLQQAPPRPTSATTYPWQPHDPYMDHSYRVPPASASAAPTPPAWNIPPPPPSVYMPSHGHPPPPPPPSSSMGAPPPISPGNQQKTTPYSSMSSTNVYQHQQQQHNGPPPPSAKTTTATAAHDIHHHHGGLPPPPLPPTATSAAAPAASSTTHHRHYVMAPLPSTNDIMTTKDAPIYGSSVHVKQQPPSTTRWNQDDTSGLNEPKMFRRLREYNELMAWMDNEFWEQNDEVYQEKLQSLQKELKSIQEGDHAAFQELVTDLEIIRDQTIESAMCFENYQMTMTKQDLDLDVMLIEEEFKNDSQHLNEVIMLVIDEHRKQIKDDREDTDELDTNGIFREAYTRIQQKRNLRKRTTHHIHANGDRPSPSRQETSSRGRRLKNTTVPPHNINAALTAKEEDDVESEYMAMKGVLPKRNGGISRR
ncbi:unnamed protein product [Absidia cylindrospora]